MRDDAFAEFLNELKAKNDIAEVIGSYIKLERKGYNYWACCPFHHDKTPSFSVNSVDKYYHCFGCGASGDVIGFIKAYENVDFNQAVEILAARAKMKVPARDERSAKEAEARKRKKDRLLALMKDAARFYRGNLYSGGADACLAYLERRGIAPTTIKKFGLGASLDYFSLPSRLLSLGYSREECLESGACSQSEQGKLIDSLGERLIVPIINQMDEVIAFGGRVIGETSRAKYKNSRETALFEKSKNLFNLNLVRREKRAGPIPYLIMVEGYMDVISLVQAGFSNVVASMGTSLTKEQVRLCKRYADSVLISYDGDFAGQKANLRGLEILKQEGIRVRVVPLPEGKDPDDVIRASGPEGYRRCLDAAMPLIDFRLRAAQSKYDLSRTDEKREFVREAIGIVREAESETEREELLKRISAATDVSMSALRRDYEGAPAKQPEPVFPVVVPAEDSVSGERKAERFVLAACLFSKPYAKDCDIGSLEFGDETLSRIADFIRRGRAQGNLRPSGLFDEMDAEGELSEVLNLDYADNLDGARAERYFRDCLATLRLRSINRKISLCREEYAAAETKEEKGEILSRLAELTRQLKNYRN